MALLLALFLLGLAGLPRPAAAQDATIKDLVVNNSDSHLLLYFTLNNCFTPEMETGIHNGIPATFTFYVELYKIKKAWPDSELLSLTFNHTLTYDSLKEEYTLILDESNETSLTDSAEQAKKTMATINGLRIIELSRLMPEDTYLLKVKAKLAKKTLPLYFHYLIPFSSLWDFETDWHTLKFRY